MGFYESLTRVSVVDFSDPPDRVTAVDSQLDSEEPDVVLQSSFEDVTSVRDASIDDGSAMDRVKLVDSA